MRWLVAAVVPTAALATAGIALATTAPGVLTHVVVTITSSKIVIPKDKFVTADGITRYPRGAVIQFKIQNKSTVPIAIRLAQTSAATGQKLPAAGRIGKPIAPGTAGQLRLSFFFRGKFELESLVGGKVRLERPIVIF